MSQQKDAASVFFPPPFIMLLGILFGYFINKIWSFDLYTILPVPYCYYIGGSLIISSIFIFDIWPILLFRQFKQNPLPWTSTPKIETRGPYQFSRNPMYLSLLLICLGVAIMLGNLWIILLIPIVAFSLKKLAIEPEEKYLQEKFGTIYLDYKNKVRRWI